MQGVAVDEDCEVCRVDLGVFGDFFHLVVGEIVRICSLCRGHNGDGLSQLCDLLGGRGGKHSQLAVSVNVLELVSYRLAVGAVGEAGDLFEVLFERDVGVLCDVVGPQ